MFHVCDQEHWRADFKPADASLDVAVGFDTVYDKLSEYEWTLGSVRVGHDFLGASLPQGSPWQLDSIGS
jgi:hypothetical protein